MRQTFKRQIIGLFLLTIILFGNLSTFAQKRSVAAKPSVTSQIQTAGNQPSREKACNSGYNGSVKYTKVIQTTATGKHGTVHNMKRTYQLNIAVRDDGRQLGSVAMSEIGLSGSFNLYGQATASENEVDDRLDVSEKDDYCKLTLRGAEGKTRVHCESRYKRTTDTTGERNDTNVYIGISGDKMNIGITSLPKLNGNTALTTNSKCSGTCSKDEPLNYTRNEKINGAGETSVATDDKAITFNPKSFNRLAGSWSKTEPTPGGTVTETFNWNLSRCAPPLEIANLRFEQKQVQSPNRWIGVDPLTGTYDGNIVKIKATVFNNGGDTAYANVKFAETKSDENLPDGTVSVAVNPGESRDVEYEWDTNGYAWNENQTKESDREIKATLEGGNTAAEKIKILPKPVILVHGLWSNAAAWAEWHGYLREAHSFAWEAFPVGEDPEHGKMNTGDYALNYDPTNSIFQNAQELGKQIKWVREQKNAWHVDLVVHSMGGLISRFYIHNFMATVYDGKPEAAHLVMLGTPNQGSACADLIYGVYNTVGDKPVEALRQLKPSVVEEYNRKTYNRKGVKFSILAGFGAGPTCGLEVGDGVVPLSSALYNLVDRGYAGTHHLALTDKKYFESFVMPRIAVGPKKAKNEQNVALLEQLNDENFTAARDKKQQNNFGDYLRNAAYKNAENSVNDDSIAADEPKNLTIRKAVQLTGRESKEIEIPVRDGSSAGVVLVALPHISATLTDSDGAVLGTSPFNDGGLRNRFRTIAVRKEIKSGVWKLKLENAANVEALVLIAGFTNGGSSSNFTVEAGKANTGGQIPLTAKWLQNNSPSINVKITGNIVGLSDSIKFFDDGNHGDAAANDGIYGAWSEKLPSGEYFLEAQAVAGSQTAIAVVNFTVGAVTAVKTAPKTTKPVAAKRKN